MLEVTLRMTFMYLIFFFVLFLDHLWVLFPDVVMVLASEIAVDVVKHAFITKFNDISADVSSLLISVGAVYSKGESTLVKISLIKLGSFQRRIFRYSRKATPHEGVNSFIFKLSNKCSQTLLSK